MPKKATTHTPGPWWVDDDGYIAAGSGDTYVTIAEGLAPSDNLDEITANLSLLAAAPELLAALNDMVQTVEYLAPKKFDDAEHEREFHARIEKARATLSKARGEA